MRLGVGRRLAGLIAAFAGWVSHAEPFTLGGQTVDLQPAGTNAPVFLRAIRPNPLAATWNVEVVVSNAGPAVLRGPFVLRVESMRNSPGVVGATGTDATGRAFVDVSDRADGGSFGPGQTLRALTLTFGRTTEIPQITLALYSQRELASPAVARIRSMTASGLPLPGAEVVEEGAARRTQTTDGRLGLATVGGGPGEVRVRLEAPDMGPAWARFDVAPGRGLVQPVPPLSPRSAGASTNLGPAGAVLAVGAARLEVPPGTGASGGSVTLQAFTGADLPAFLPPGWRLAAAARYESGNAAPARLALRPEVTLPPAVNAALARWEEKEWRWRVEAVSPGRGDSPLEFSVTPGLYALVTRDEGAGAPAAPTVGVELPGGTLPAPSVGDLVAGGTVQPAARPASRVAEQVTAWATVRFTNRVAALASGTVFRCDVQEEYLLRDGSRRVPPRHERFVVGQRPGLAGPTNVLEARFPLRPLLLLGGEELAEAVIRVEVLGVGAFPAALLEESGGLLEDGGVGIRLAEGDLAGAQVATLVLRDPGQFAGVVVDGLRVAAAFDLSLPAVRAGRRLALSFPVQPAGRQFVLARTVMGEGAYGVQPVERLASGADGVVRSTETAGPAGLAGVDGPGQYLLVEVPSAQAIVEGVAREAGGAARAGLVLRLGPWLALSGPGGSYRLVAPAGSAEVRMLDPRSGDAGRSRVEVPAGLAVTTADVAGTAGGPVVLAVSPAAGAVNVPRVTPVTLTFSRPLNPATVVGEALKLVAPDGTTVPASVSLNLARTGVTLLPTANLPPSSALRIQVAATVADATGRPVEGGREFGFTTESDVLRRADATLVIHEPVNGIAPMVGGPGLAEPESPVILVNDATGFTATVLSRPDGSFSNSIPASVEDLLSVVIVNRNGSRNVVPASRQLFRDGRVGLYAGGGTIAAEGPGGRVELIVGANAIRERAVFRVEPTTTASVVAEAGGVQPVGARLMRGLRVQVQGDVPTEGIDVAFAVDPAEFQLPAGEAPEEAVLALLAPQEVDGVMAYRMVDKLRYENGRVFSNTKPFTGVGGLVGSMIIDALVNLNTTLAFFGGKPVVVSGQAVEPALPIDQLADRLQMPTFQLEALLTGGFVANLTGGADTIDAFLQNREYFKPAAGAFVFARPLTVESRRPGRIEAGAVYATVDREGVYALALPIKVGEAAVPFAPVPGYVLVGVHPRYDKRVSEDLSFSEIGVDFGERPFFRRNLLFGGPLAGGTPPTLDVQVAMEPTSPAIGQAARIRAVAFSSQSEATFEPTIEAVASTVAGVEVSASDLSLGSKHTVYLGRGRTEFTVEATAQKPMQALIRVQASVQTPTGTLTDSAVVFVRFGEGEPPLPDVLEPAEGELDVTGPGVLRANLAEGATLPVGGRIVLHFSEPVKRTSLHRVGAVRFDPAPLTPPALFLSADQTVLEVAPGLFDEGVDEVQLSLTSAILDLADRRFDQSTEPGEQSYQLKFRPGTVRRRTLAGVEQGGGVVSYRGFIYALDRGPTPRVQVYRQEGVLTGSGTPVATLPLSGAPRDLLVIRDWPHKRSLHDAVDRTSDLLVVVGGNAGSSNVDSDRNVFFPGQYLRVYDLAQPAAPERILGAMLTLRNSLVTRVAWHPPHLAFLESGSDLQQVLLMDLQSMLIGFNATPAEVLTFPLDPFTGKDADQDGSYLQEGDELPLPERRPIELFGRVANYLLDEFGLIQDVAMAQGFVGAVTTGGRDPELPDSLIRLPAFRTFRAGGESVPPGTGVLLFGGSARPKRVTVLLDELVSINGQLQRRSLGLVSMAPDHDNKPKVVLVDLANPLAPSRFPDEIELPASLGQPQGITRREDGLLALATTTHLVLLDPLRLLERAPGNVGLGSGANLLHPAIVSMVPHAGSGNRTLDSNPDGVHLVNLGARRELVQAPPRLSFVIFPTNGTVVSPASFAGNDAAVGLALAGMRPLTGLPLARMTTKGGAVGTIDPPSPLTHSHVLIDAPGSAGAELAIALESLNAGGYALKDKGQDFAAVRAVSEAALLAMRQAESQPGGTDPTVGPFRAKVRGLRAYRLGSDPRSRYYNLYLSEPFALVREKVTRQQSEALTAGRPILFSGHSLRASLDFSMAGNPVVGPFASRVAAGSRSLLPGAYAVAETLSTSYIPGDNPPPPGSEVSFPGTFGMVNALNGEMRRTELDVELPGRRLPIRFQRTLAGQDLNDGPFGPGWDFFHNQHLVEFKASLFPPGNKAPIVVRPDAQRSTITEARDVQWVDGLGHVVLFKHRGTTAPEGVANDPLCEELGWFRAGGAFYTPDLNTKGVFDLLYRFPAGEFCRLTPDGTQYWYGGDGRLLRIRHRHVKNLQVMEYNDRGELVRIADTSVDPPRVLRIGRYRLAGDLRSDLDEETDSAFVAGQICTLEDPAGRKWTFEYARTGTLIRRLGPETDSTAQSSEGKVGFKGRPTTTYLMSGPSAAHFRGVRQGNGAHDPSAENADTALFKAKTVPGAAKPVVQEGSGAGGTVGVAVPPDNSAETGAEQAGGVGTRADRSASKFSFNNFGQPTLLSRTGSGAEEANTGVVYHEESELRGLVKTVTGRMGDVVSFEYFNGSLIRSKPNIRRITRTPGERGGTAISTSFSGYEQRYNLPTGAGLNENGKPLTYTLTSDAREIESLDFGDGGVMRRTYNDYGQRTLESSPDGVVQTWSHDGTTGFLTSESVGGVPTGYRYEGALSRALGVPDRVLLPRGAPVTVQYDARLLPLLNARGLQQVRMGYDENGNQVYLGVAVDAGVTREEVRRYSQVNFLTSIRELGVEGAVGTAEVLETVYSPDPVFRIGKITLPDGETQEATYDHLGRLLSLKTGDHVREFSYDLNGNRRKTKVSNDGLIGGLTGSIIEELEYDGHDRVVQVKKPAQGGVETTKLDYHPGGQLLSRTVTGPSGGVVEEITFRDIDGYGRPKRVIRGGDTVSATTELSYDVSESGLTLTEKGPHQRVTRTFDAAGRAREVKDTVATRTITPNGSFRVEKVESVEDGVTYLEQFDFDTLDRRTRVFDGVGDLMVLTPRLDGLPVRTRDGRGNETTIRYSTRGEALRVERLESLRMDTTLDGNRRPKATLDRAGKGLEREYADGRLRMTKLTLRDGSVIEFKEPNGLNLPEEIVLPGGGSVSMAYDGQGRPTESIVEFGGTTYELENVRYDALGRVRSQEYKSHAEGSKATFTYDKLGPLTGSTYEEGGATYVFVHGIRADGRRVRIDYPSGVRVTEARDDSGRLTGVTIAEGAAAGPVWEAVEFAGTSQPKRIRRGGVLEETREYDQRRRLVAHKVVARDQRVVADWRFRWDATDNLVARQALHEQGRTDLFQYDGVNRLSRVHFGARPGVVGTPVPGLVPEEGLQPGFAARRYEYDSDGLDLLVGSAPVEQPEPKPWAVPAFPAVIGGHNGFLFAGEVDGLPRVGTDALGNAREVRHRMADAGGSMVPATATLTHNGRNELVAARRGIQDFTFHVRPDHLVHRKTRTEGAAGPALDRALVWDQGLLMEEYDLTASPAKLVARYYYAGTDTPVAADLADAAGELRRYHFIHDHVMSVTAVADAEGQVIERSRYEPWGQSVTEARDTVAPRIHRVFEEGSGAILVEFTEPVLPRAGAGSGIVTEAASLSEALRVTQGGADVGGAFTPVDHVPGLPFGTVFRFRPESAASGGLELRMEAGRLLDAWGNGNVAETVTVPLAGGAGIRFTGTVSSTRPAVLARSAVGNPFGFQGGYAEPDLGLIYLRARWYDPNTGTFLEQDPAAYSDSVNGYAGFANNPMSRRDPTGTSTGGKVAKEVAEEVTEILTRSFQPPIQPGEESAKYLERIAAYLENQGDIEKYGAWFRKHGLDLEFIGAGASKIVFGDPKTGRAYSVLRGQVDEEGVMVNLRGAQIWDALGLNNYHGIHNAGEFKLGGEAFERPLIISDVARGFRDESPGHGNGSIYRPLEPDERARYLPEAQRIARRIYEILTGMKPPKDPKKAGKYMHKDWAQWGVDESGRVRFVDAPNASAEDLARFWENFLGPSKGPKGEGYLNNPD